MQIALPDFQQILSQTFQTLFSSFANFIPKFLGFVVMLLIGWMVAKVVAIVVGKALEKIGIDVLADKLKKIDVLSKFISNVKLSILCGKVLYFFILLIFLTAATETLGMPVLTALVASLVAMIPNVIAATIMLLIGILIASNLQKFVVTACKSFNISAGKLLGSAVFFFILAIALIGALKQAGIETALLESSFNLLIGGIIFAFAISYGLASRDILANILSSFYSKNKYKEGQLLSIDGVKGTIISIDSTSVVLQTADNQTIIPLHRFQTQKVEIYS
jgi:small-conductance mechanosensitive channel